jgi:predicted XRE-type DNA-binding protein
MVYMKSDLEPGRLAEELLIPSSLDRIRSREGLFGEFVQRIHRALKALSDRDRIIIALLHFEKLSQDEVAQVLDISKSDLEDMYRAALRRLEKALSNVLQAEFRSSIRIWSELALRDIPADGEKFGLAKWGVLTTPTRDRMPAQRLQTVQAKGDVSSYIADQRR